MSEKMKISGFEVLWSIINVIIVFVGFMLVNAALPLPAAVSSTNIFLLFLIYLILALFTAMFHGEAYTPIIALVQGLIFALAAFFLNVTGYVPGAYAVIGFFIAAFASWLSFMITTPLTEALGLD